MHKSSLRLLSLSLISFVLLSFTLDVEAQDQPIPYVYYFSHLDNALIIERADGTDSRLIGELLPEDHDRVIMRGWSASGRWFALSSYHTIGEPVDYQVLTQIISADGERRINLGIRPWSTIFMQWSPHDDTMAIVEEDWLSGDIHLRLLDVENETPIAETSIQHLDRDFSTHIDLTWSDDGLTAYAAWRPQIVALHSNGTTEVWIDPEDRYWQRGTSFHRGRLFYVQRSFPDYPTLIHLEDLETGQTLEFEDMSRGHVTSPYRIHWSPNLKYALIYAYPCVDSSCEAWLKLVDWEAGEVKTITPTLFFRAEDYECERFNRCNIWSQQGQFAVLVDEDEETYTLNALTGDIQLVDANMSEYGSKYLWMPDETLFLHTDDVRIFDPKTGEYTSLNLASESTFDRLSFSPSGQLIGLHSHSPGIIDRSGQLVLQLPPHSYSITSARYPGAYQWAVGETWTMLHDYVSFAGGDGLRTSVVADLNGTVRRELTSIGEIGFLPESVLSYLSPGQSTSFKPDATYTLIQEGLVQVVGWHPSDHNQLVTYSSEAGLIFWSLADGAPKITGHATVDIAGEVDFSEGMRLLWLPAQHAVGFYAFTHVVWFDLETGAHIELEGVNYPFSVRTGTSWEMRCSASNSSMMIDGDSFPYEGPQMLTCGQVSQLLFWGWSFNPGDHVNLTTGESIALQVNGDFTTGDAQNGIAALAGIRNCCISVASTETGELINEFYGTAYSLALSADARWLATTSRGMTAIWDMSEYVERGAPPP